MLFRSFAPVKKFTLDVSTTANRPYLATVNVWINGNKVLSNGQDFHAILEEGSTYKVTVDVPPYITVRGPRTYESVIHRNEKFVFDVFEPGVH